MTFSFGRKKKSKAGRRKQSYYSRAKKFVSNNKGKLALATLLGAGGLYAGKKYRDRNRNVVKKGALHPWHKINIERGIIKESDLDPSGEWKRVQTWVKNFGRRRYRRRSRRGSRRSRRSRRGSRRYRRRSRRGSRRRSRRGSRRRSRSRRRRSRRN